MQKLSTHHLSLMQTSSAGVRSYLVIPVCVIIVIKLSLAAVSVLLMMVYSCS